MGKISTIGGWQLESVYIFFEVKIPLFIFTYLFICLCIYLFIYLCIIMAGTQCYRIMREEDRAEEL